MTYHNMSKSPAVFDMTKLRWMNGEYLKKMDFEPFYAQAVLLSKGRHHKAPGS